MGSPSNSSSLTGVSAVTATPGRCSPSGSAAKHGVSMHGPPPALVTDPQSPAYPLSSGPGSGCTQPRQKMLGGHSPGGRRSLSSQGSGESSSISPPVRGIAGKLYPPQYGTSSDCLMLSGGSPKNVSPTRGLR